ncbi:FAD-dependent oxidoreductase [Paraburkholderia phymatum]|uniref:NAD(P)/FAD-dependent oxidoreductase n=1 Tax=Paraburkholderia phymatum TaxID=148447 RepID=UPI00316E6CB6
MQLDISTGRVVIVGAGQAGAELAGALRSQGFAGSITLLGDERYPPYRRPPLSKAFLAGEVSLESLYLKTADAYEKQGIQCMLGTAVERIDRDAHRICLADGSVLPYDKLGLATGGRARKLPLPGATHSNVHYVRNIEDIQRLRTQFEAGRRLVIIGGGYIGLETASVAVKAGLHVCVIEGLPRVLARVTVPEISAYYESVHRARGVEIRTGVGVRALDGARKVEALVLTDGQRVDADLVVIGIGLVPNTELAEAAGLEVSNGIVVDAHLLTSDPDIVACGDCTFHENVFYQRRMRLESVPNALEQARVAAANMIGKPAAYSAVPWFWSDQYDLKLQMVGLSEGFDQFVVRGAMEKDRFVAFYLREGVVISADAVNRPQEFMVAKRLVAERVKVDAARLIDESSSLKDVMADIAHARIAQI